jgi:hypothetical protein
MDDPYFDHRSAKRFDRQRASGPFGVDELLPKKITAWLTKKHPETGEKQVLLNFGLAEGTGRPDSVRFRVVVCVRVDLDSRQVSRVPGQAR